MILDRASSYSPARIFFNRHALPLIFGSALAGFAPPPQALQLPVLNLLDDNSSFPDHMEKYIVELQSPNRAQREGAFIIIEEFLSKNYQVTDAAIDLYDRLMPHSDMEMAHKMAISIIQRAVGRKHDVQVIKAIRHILDHDQRDQHNRVTAIIKLGALGYENPAYHEEAMDRLIDFLTQQRQGGSIAPPGFMRDPLDIAIKYSVHKDRLKDFVIELKQDKDPEWRMAAIVGMSGLAAAYPALRTELLSHLNQMMEQDEKDFVRSFAALSIGSIACEDEDFIPEATAFLTSLLNHPELGMQFSAVGTLQDIVSKCQKTKPEIVPPIFKALKERYQHPIDPVLEPRMINALGAIARTDKSYARKVLPLLIENTIDKPDAACETSIYHLSVNVPHHLTFLDEAITAVKMCLQDDDPVVRVEAEQALETLEIIKIQQAIVDHLQLLSKIESHLDQALQDEDEARRILPDVLTLSSTQNEINRRKAVEILGNLTRAHSGLAAEIFDRLSAMTDDAASSVRFAVTQAVGIIGIHRPDMGTEILPLLHKLAGDNEPMISSLALSGVGMIATHHQALRPDAIAILNEFRDSSNSMIRTTVNNHLRTLQKTPQAQAPAPL